MWDINDDDRYNFTPDGMLSGDEVVEAHMIKLTMDSNLERLREAHQLIREGLNVLALEVVDAKGRGLILSGCLCLELMIQDAKKKG